MVDLRAEPYCLSGGDAAWVKVAIASMTDEEKAGQLLFCGNAAGETPRELVEQYHIGGFRCALLPSRQARELSHALQTASPIPLFIASDTECGGIGAAADGTYIACGRKIAATGRPQYARELGFLANEEAAAMGNNMSFAPVCGPCPDGEDAQWIRQTADMGAAYVAGVHDLPGYASVCRCLPCAPREDACGTVCGALIDAGADGVLAADPADAGRLRDAPGFQGLVICDTAPMTGAARGELLAAAVNGGCDMLLCPGGVGEDFAAVLAACRDGVIGPARLDDALARILGLKARMGLNKRPRAELVPSAAALAATLGAPKYKAAAEAITRDAITLVCCRNPELLPLAPEKYPRVLLADVEDGPDNSPAELLCRSLCDKGFDAFVYGGGEPIQAPELVLPVSGTGRFGPWGEHPSPVPGVPAIGVSVGAPAAPADAPALDALVNAYDAQPLTLDVLVEKLLAGPEAFTGITPIGS